MTSINIVVNHKNRIFNFNIKEVNAETEIKQAIMIEDTNGESVSIDKISVVAKLTSPTSGKVELVIQAYKATKIRGGYRWSPVKDTAIEGVFDIKDTMRFDYGEYEFVGRRENY